MTDIHAAWHAQQRARWERANAHLFFRHDAWRFAPACKRATKRFRAQMTLDLSAALAESENQQCCVEWAELSQLRRELVAIKGLLALRRMLRERKYSPDQPRVPAGTPDGGQWTTGEGDSDSQPVQLAANDTPEIPKQRPKTAQERNRIGRGVARWGGALELLFQAIPWLEENADRVDAYRDPPKTLEELQQGALEPKSGYDIHHIVEQSSAEQDGFPRSQINAPENLVRISTYKHWDINSWYQTRNDQYGGLSPRDYLRGRGWDERREVGLKALVDFGVLSP